MFNPEGWSTGCTNEPAATSSGRDIMKIEARMATLAAPAKDSRINHRLAGPSVIHRRPGKHGTAIRLDGSYILRLRTLRALGNPHGDFLAFGQGLASATVDGAV